MDKKETITIELPVFHNNVNKGVEKMEVEWLGVNKYRLLSSPGFVGGLAAGDEIELAPEEIVGYKILNRSKNLCIWFYMSAEQKLSNPEVQQLISSVEKIGGWLDGGLRTLLIFTVPVSSGFNKIEHLFDTTINRYNGTAWFYGNVYDPKTDLPLNWW